MNGLGQLPTLAALSVAAALAAAGCGGDGKITVDASCPDFLNAPQGDQAAVVAELAQEYDKEMPGGGNYYCSENPDSTIREYVRLAH